MHNNHPNLMAMDWLATGENTSIKLLGRSNLRFSDRTLQGEIILLYSEKVMEHFRNPHNAGEIKDADGIGRVGNPVCGDLMVIYIKVSKDPKGVERLSDVKFKTFGCGAAIATSSMVTDLAKGKTLEEAMKITREDVATSLDGLPPIKMHCSNLASDGLRAAIEDYLKKKKSGQKK